MRVAVFSSRPYDKSFLQQANTYSEITLQFIDGKLELNTVPLCRDYRAISVFVNDNLDREVLLGIQKQGVQHIALRCAGFNNLDLNSARELGLTVSRVPDYSPYAVAEHTVALILTLNRKLHKSYNRVKEGNFSIDGLLGFDLRGKTVGIVGTGKIGLATAAIISGFGCKLLCYDKFPKDKLALPNAQYCALTELFQQSDIISLHCPLNEDTYHLINAHALDQMKDGVMLINTSRGGLIDTAAVVRGLKSKRIGYLGLDVYEMESELFFEDKSLEIIQDDLFQRLSTFPNVIITGHQGFFTQEALQKIAATTLHNLELFRTGKTDPVTFL